jgi:hypothetical protein
MWSAPVAYIDEDGSIPLNANAVIGMLARAARALQSLKLERARGHNVPDELIDQAQARVTVLEAELARHRIVKT